MSDNGKSEEAPFTSREEEVRRRVLNNKALMDQVRAGWEAIDRGERGVPLRELIEQERRERVER